MVLDYAREKEDNVGIEIKMRIAHGVEGLVVDVSRFALIQLLRLQRWFAVLSFRSFWLRPCIRSMFQPGLVSRSL